MKLLSIKLHNMWHKDSFSLALKAHFFIQLVLLVETALNGPLDFYKKIGPPFINLLIERTAYADNMDNALSAFVAAKMIGARLGRWDIPGDPPMGSPSNAVVGLCMLWWSWLAFNAGSTFGIITL